MTKKNATIINPATARVNTFGLTLSTKSLKARCLDYAVKKVIAPSVADEYAIQIHRVDLRLQDARARVVGHITEEEADRIQSLYTQLEELKEKKAEALKSVRKDYKFEILDADKALKKVYEGVHSDDAMAEALVEWLKAYGVADARTTSGFVRDLMGLWGGFGAVKANSGRAVVTRGRLTGGRTFGDLFQTTMSIIGDYLIDECQINPQLCPESCREWMEIKAAERKARLEAKKAQKKAEREAAKNAQ